MIKDLQELADYVGATFPTETALGRRLYKDTMCGVWISILHHDKTQQPIGVSVGSIVEGSQDEVAPNHLFFPFSEQMWEESLCSIEEQADFLWHEANFLEEHAIRSCDEYHDAWDGYLCRCEDDEGDDE